MENDSKLTLKDIQRAVSGNAAAFRCRRRLQPAGGQGEKIFPPTFAGAGYAIEHRRIPGKEESVPCVLLDSIQSQANRMEEALQQAVEKGEIQIPVIEVDFSGSDLRDPIGKISSLQMPHRVADAIIRDSNFEGEPFRKSEIGRRLDFASASNATPLFEICPTALLFGMWDSTGPKGGSGVKFERAIVSEVVGVGVPDNQSIKHRGVRRDPLNISKNVPIRRTDDAGWEIAKDAKVKGSGKPSEINHGNVPFDSANLGVTIDYAEQTTTLSLICLRRLSFPPAPGQRSDPKADDATRTVLAALGLCAATLAFDAGLGLRSRCLLWPDEAMIWELLEAPGKPPTKLLIDRILAVELLNEAVAGAEKAGMKWRKQPLGLQPKPDLVKLVRLSQDEMIRKNPEAN